MHHFRLPFLVLVLLAVTGLAAYADCYKNEQAYPTGTVIDGFVCQADGQWVRINP